jgi:hypothetical protein
MVRATVPYSLRAVSRGSGWEDGVTHLIAGGASRCSDALLDIATGSVIGCFEG